MGPFFSFPPLCSISTAQMRNHVIQWQILQTRVKKYIYKIFPTPADCDVLPTDTGTCETDPDRFACRKADLCATRVRSRSSPARISWWCRRGASFYRRRRKEASRTTLRPLSEGSGRTPDTARPLPIWSCGSGSNGFSSRSCGGSFQLHSPTCGLP